MRMMRPVSTNPRGSKARTRVRFVALLLMLALTAGGFAWWRWVDTQIERYAGQDQAAPSAAIAVFGAAEYDGKPSPIFRARLDHALALYHRGLAPLIITAGGPGGDGYTEGAVGQEYLMSMGVPEGDIISETESLTSEDSARRIAVIARTNNLHRLIVVSDATHLFRIHEICAADGLNVLTSPRPRVAIEGGADDTESISREILSYTLWRLHLH
jgi:uncharacterized SAM-binding protein YcdF (DUF218 family)